MLTLSPVSNPVWRYHRRDGEAEIGGLQSWAQEALREKCGLEVKARATRYLRFSYSPSLVCICLRRSFCAAVLTQHLGKAELEREQEGSVSACQNRRQNKGRQADWQEPTPLPPCRPLTTTFPGTEVLGAPWGTDDISSRENREWMSSNAIQGSAHLREQPQRSNLN